MKSIIITKLADII